jgi:hypothetical protein
MEFLGGVKIAGESFGEAWNPRFLGRLTVDFNMSSLIRT